MRQRLSGYKRILRFPREETKRRCDGCQNVVNMVPGNHLWFQGRMMCGECFEMMVQEAFDKAEMVNS